jgi:hypothetical protein
MLQYMTLAALVSGVAMGCSNDEPEPTPGSADASVVANTDANSNSSPDASAPSATARLFGMVTRSAEPTAGGDGDLYIAVFDKDPVLDMDTAQVVARNLVENADLSAGNASVAYEVLDIPPRAEAYYLVAFLDDNDSVNPENPDEAGPDGGDLLSLRGFSSPTIEVRTSGDHQHDIDLNSVLPSF